MKQQTESLPTTISINQLEGPQLRRIISITEPQAEIWAACTIGGKDANRAYNESVSISLKGGFVKNALQTALEKLIERHEVLRSVFSADGRFLCVFDAVEVLLDEQDFSSLSNAEKDKRIAALVQEDILHVFDLVKGPLVKMTLIKINAEEHCLLLTAHHIICDGWSLGILLKEMSVLYSAFSENEIPNLPQVVPFSDYADEQLELIGSEKYQEIEQFWLNQYKNQVPLLKMPIDFVRPVLRTYKSQRLDFELESKILNSFRQVGIKTGCSLVTTFITAFEVFLYLLTGEEGIVLGLPAAGQSASGMIELVGHCVNLLPLRSKVDGSMNFRDYITKRKTDILDAYEHQDFTFGRLLKKLNIARDPSRIPLVPVVLNIDMGLTNEVDFKGLDFELKSNPRAFETFELFLNISGSGDRLVFEWSYNCTLFEENTIKEMMQSFERVIISIAENPTLSLKDIKLSDYGYAYSKLNDSAQSYPVKPLHELLAAQAKNTPMYSAVRFNEQVLSYENLHEKVNQFAHYLIKQKVKPGDTIALALPRLAEIPVALIAILQCGANYLPLDPDYPVSRLAFMINDAEVHHILTTREFEPIFRDMSSTLLLENILPQLELYPVKTVDVVVDPETTAYIIYTSGSTGTPKGVRVTHRSLVNFLYSMGEEPGIQSEDNLLSITTISFDIAGLELFLPLLCGATLIIAPTEVTRDGRLMLEMLQEENISILQATPSTFKMLLDAGWTDPLPLKILCGGESLPLNLAKALLEKCDTLWNMYGPTETTIWSTVKQITEKDKLISIGKPIANTQVYITDRLGKLVAPGRKGEIIIAGDGVSLGYWQRSQLTSEKFVENKLNDKCPLVYCTGDLGKLLPSGEIQCLGRLDQQVKIRGHRIELGEIEQVIMHLDNVKAAVVLALHDVLVAHVVLNVGYTLAVQECHEKLSEKLPAIMIPQEFKILEEIPLTLNGKIDRNALMGVAAVEKSPLVSITQPRTQAEEKVAVIWKKALNLENIDIFSNFFELGGHSLIAVQVMSRIEQETGKRLPLSSLFEYSTIEKLAQLLDADSAFVTWDSLVPIKPAGSKPPLYIVHGGGLNVLIFNALARNMDNDQPVYGLQAKGLDGVETPLESVEEIAVHYIHEIMENNPEGPYALAGYSFGGIIAYEMAKQLMAKGKTVKTLALLDTYAELPYYYKTDFRKRMAGIEYGFKKSIYNLKNVRQTYTKLFQKIGETPNAVYQLYLKARYGRAIQHELRHSQPYSLDVMNIHAMRNYQLHPLAIKIDLLRAKNITYYMHDMTWLGWKPFALKGVEIHEIPGEHSYIFSPPYDKKSARILQQILDNS